MPLKSPPSQTAIVEKLKDKIYERDPAPEWSKTRELKGDELGDYLTAYNPLFIQENKGTDYIIYIIFEQEASETMTCKYNPLNKINFGNVNLLISHIQFLPKIRIFYFLLMLYHGVHLFQHTQMVLWLLLMVVLKSTGKKRIISLC